MFPWSQLTTRTVRTKNVFILIIPIAWTKVGNSGYAVPNVLGGRMNCVLVSKRRDGSLLCAMCVNNLHFLI